MTLLSLLPNSPALTVAMVGVGGTGMKGLAYLLSNKNRIIGTDATITNLAADANLTRTNIVSEQKLEESLSECNLLIYSDAVPTTNQLRRLAQAKGIPQLCFNEAVGQLIQDYKTIAITGTHGKSSTTAMLAHIFVKNDRDPTVLIGASVPAWAGSNARIGSGKYFIAEADEYREHFLSMSPDIIVITSIDFDHPDYFSSLADVKKSFDRFIKKLRPDGQVFTTEAIKKDFPDICWPKETHLVNLDTYPNIKAPLPGEHMRLNAALAIAVASHNGIAVNDSTTALQSFAGLGRRTELIGTIGNLKLFSDYGHHPTEIRATLQGLKNDTGQKILAIVEIHTQQRLAAFQKEFAIALTSADGVLFTPVFIPTGRENETQQASRQLQNLFYDLQQQGIPAWNASSYDNTVKLLKKIGRDYDLAILFSAGPADRFFKSNLDS